MSKLLDWARIDWVLLDMDGTLLDLHYDNHFWLEFMPRRYAQAKGLPLEEGRAELLGLYKQAEGTLNWYCFDYWTTTLGLDIAELSEEVAHLVAVQPYVHEFLDGLRALGKRVVLVTNSHSKGLALKMQRTQLAERLDLLVCSHALGLPKEDPRFWDALRGVEAYDPARAVLVDDSLPVLRAARDYGIAHLLAVRRPDTRQPPRDITEFPSVGGFQELLPV